jgi:hypothetical protein
MKPTSILLIVALAISAGASRALAQHGHGMGPMATHGDMDHAQGHQANTAGHIPVNSNTAATRLAHNSALSARLQPLLPSGTNLQTAASGFKNLGQFVAAVHVSHNLKIPFDQLKAKMTGSNPESLGRAVQDLEPNLSQKTLKTDVKTAERQAKQDLETTEQADKDDKASTVAQTHD